MQNFGENDTREQFHAALVAAGCNDWREAARNLGLVHNPITIDEIVGSDQSALLADACWRGGHVMVQNLDRIIRRDANMPWLVSGADFPQILTGELFDAESKAFRTHVENRDWKAAVTAFGRLLRFPGANSGRGARLEASFALATLHAEHLQENTLALISKIRPARHWTLEDLPQYKVDVAAFELPGLLIQEAAVSDLYPRLAESLLLQLLKVADWPILKCLRYPFIGALSAELISLWDQAEALLALGRPGREWLERAVSSDGTSEQFSADELT